jgi:HEAT repeat protein
MSLSKKIPGWLWGTALVAGLCVAVGVWSSRDGALRTFEGGASPAPFTPAPAGREEPVAAVSFPADEAVRRFAAARGVAVRVVSAPDRTATLPPATEPPTKALSKLAAALRLPLLASAKRPEAELAPLTLTRGGIIMGAGNPALEAALERLGSDDADERVGGLAALETLDDPRVEAAFMDRLKNDAAPEVRGAAAAALEEATNADSHRALAAALGDPDEWVVDNARIAIQQLGPKPMEPFLRAVLAHPHEGARLEAADLLERIFGLEIPENFWAAGGRREVK